MNKKLSIKSLFLSIRKHPVVTVFLIICFLFPLFIQNNYWQKFAGEIFFFAALGCAWNIIGGYARQTSWAHAAFFAVGAYSGILMYLKLGVSPWIGLIVGCLLAAVLAVIIGLPTFKLRGIYFAIATIACCTIIERLLIYFNDFTGGSAGVALPAIKSNSVWTLSFKKATPYYYIALGIMLISVIICLIIERTRLGYYLRAIREDEDAVNSLGIHTYRVKLIALIISASLTAAVGTFYVFRLRYTDPLTVATHDIAVRIGLTAIIGGMGTAWGPVLGALFTVPLLQISNAYLGNVGGGGLALVVYGAMIIFVVLFQPGGIIALCNSVIEWGKKCIKRRKEGEEVGKNIAAD